MPVAQSILYVTLVLGLGAPSAVDFDTDVAPILTKAGCNAAACHGSAAGRGNFKLSLFAGDLTADYDAIVRQFEGRRINLSNPQSSLLLAKPLGMLDHEGGVRFDFGHAFDKTITQWIAAGAPRHAARHYTALRIELPSEQIRALPANLPLRVMALLEDTDSMQHQWVDVTQLAVFIPEDDEALIVDDNGLLTIHRGGRHTLV